MASPPVVRPFIRPYRSAADEAALIHIETLPEALKPTSAWAIGPYIWSLPYGRLVPEFCFVLDSGPTTAVGYIVGTPSLSALLAQYSSKYLPHLSSSSAIDIKGVNVDLSPPRPSPLAGWNDDLQTCLLQRVFDPSVAGDLSHADFPELLEQYPAHLHIDILPEFQGKGYGRELMKVFLRKLNEEGVKGVHLIMDGENFGAEQFYKRVGFERFGMVLDRGASGELGRHADGTMWMVKSLGTNIPQ